MYSEVSCEKLYFQIVAKLDVDKKSKGVRLSKIVEDGDFIKAAFMASSKEEYLQIRNKIEKMDENLSLKGVGKGLNLIVKGRNRPELLIKALSQIKNFEAETEKFVQFLVKLLGIISNLEIKFPEICDTVCEIKSLNCLEKIVNIGIEIDIPKELDKDDFYNKFLNLKLDYDFGIIK